MSERLTIYHIEGRRSFRVIWLCEELSIPYELVFKRGDILGSLVTIREVHPLMPVSPTVRLDGELFVESGAIVEVLQARYGKGRLAPSVDSADYPFHVQWMHFAEGSAMARFVTTFTVAQAMGVTVDKLPSGYRAGGNITEMITVGALGIFDYMEDFLSKHAYFGGAQFTTADIMMHYSIRGAKLAVWVDSSDFPRIAAWRANVESRPAFKRATAAATPGGADEYGMPADVPFPPSVVRPPARRST
ncbi:MAG TPA: glutathione S-transferase family protein [Steroidobacteraceae bacterium]|nr:glutathione S-transferase family protein [Steroidobacteraceae bacterium]